VTERKKETLSAKSPAHETLQDPRATRLHVLVVDASRQPMPAVQEMCQRANVHLVRALRVEAGIQCLNDERFDVVMMDLMLPGMGPLESLVCLSNRHPQVPVVVVTQLDDPEIADMALQSGASDYLIKSDLQYATLIRSLRYAIERHRRQCADQEVLVVQEKERKRLSRELHDGVIQTINTMRLQMQMLARELHQRDTEASDAVRRLADDAQTAIDEVRQVSRGLHSTILEHQTLPEALRAYAHDLQSQFTLQVDVQGQERNLDCTVKEHLYRICQECIRNAVRHGKANQIRIRFVHEQDQLEMEVRDNGQGFDVNLAFSSDEMGLSTIRERATLLGGDVVVESHEGAGTSIRVEVPVTCRRTP